MTQEQRSPLESALDLFVYAPVGLALTAVEEMPKLAEKGRAQVQGQIAIARVVGQFAVNMGRKEIEKRLGQNSRPSSPDASTPRMAASAPAKSSDKAASEKAPVANRASSGAAGRDSAGNGANGVAPFHSDLTDPDGGYRKLSGRTDDETDPEQPTAEAGTLGSRGNISSVGRSSPSADELAIPGYDSLSASQVVQRLAGLSKEELEAVGAYESAHRARRTILTRVNQLKA